MRYDLNIDIGKTKIMVFVDDIPIALLKVNNEETETVNQFIYLDSLITSDNDCSAEIRMGLELLLGL